MKRVAILFTAGVLAAACSDTPVSPETGRTLQPNFAATTSTTSVQIPINFILPAGFAGCTEEPIQFTGTLHIVMHFTTSASGRSLSHLSFNDLNFAGVGLETGAKYRRTGATTQTEQVDGPLPIVVTITDAFNFIGQGSAPNLLIHTTFHVTVNANGEVTAEIDDFRLDCK